MALLAGLGLTLPALAMIALAMTRHHRQVFTGGLSTRRARVRRASGFLLLACAPAPAMYASGGAIGFVTWLFGYLPLSGLLVIVILAMLPPSRD